MTAAEKTLKVLVVGGAGYIGSHMVQMLVEAGHEVVTLDNLSNGYRDAVLGGTFVKGDLADQGLLGQLFADHRFDGVMHFASFIQVGESTTHPAKYYENNVVNTLDLLNAMRKAEVSRFIFSSTAAVYGEPQHVPIDEAHPKGPINPYGRSKWMVEQMLEDFDAAYGLKYIALRYFNAAGADPQGRLGERHEPETHLIPLILQAASGRRAAIRVFGRDYPTEDGTCVRDYIHVTDLCDAHLRALNRLVEGGNSDVFNLGNSQGFSVQQVIATVKQVTGKDFIVEESPRRDGDPAVLVADATRAKKELQWQPRYDALPVIIEHAWAWENKNRSSRSN